MAMGRSLDEFDDRAPDALASTHMLGEFPHREAISILKTGSY